MYTHFRGTTFQFIGQLQDDGVIQDLTGCVLSASVYDQSGTILYGALNIKYVDLPEGLVSLSYPNTSNWPIGKARIDMTLKTANNEIIASPPDFFRIQQSPIIG